MPTKVRVHCFGQDKNLDFCITDSTAVEERLIRMLERLKFVSARTLPRTISCSERHAEKVRGCGVQPRLLHVRFGERDKHTCSSPSYLFGLLASYCACDMCFSVLLCLTLLRRRFPKSGCSTSLHYAALVPHHMHVSDPHTSVPPLALDPS